MKLIEKIFSGIRHHAMMSLPVAALLLASCAAENLEEPTGDTTSDNQTSENAVFLSLRVSAEPVSRSSRAETDNEGNPTTEEGQDYENTINTVGLILADENGKILATFPNESKKSFKDERIEVIYEKDYNDIQALLDAAEDGKVTAYAYVVCNGAGLSISESLTLQQVMEVTSQGSSEELNPEDVIKQYGGYFINKKEGEDGNMTEEIVYPPFLMSNGDFLNEEAKEKYKVVIDIEELLKHNNINNPYRVNLSTKQEDPPIKIDVQRALARFDLGGEWKDYVYYFDEDGFALGTGIGTNNQAPENSFVQISLKYIGLANINKKFNLYKQTGLVEGGNKKDGEWGYFWSENVENRYVFDPQYLTKKTALEGYSEGSTTLNSYYINALMDPEWLNDGYFRGVENLLGNNDLHTDDKKFHIWTYCTPNTIHETEWQKNGITTAVVFAARLNFIKGGLKEGTHLASQATPEGYKDDKEIKAKLKETPIYAFKGRFYGTNRELLSVMNAATNTKDMEMRRAFEKVMESFNPDDELWEYKYQEGDEEKTKYFTNSTLRDVEEDQPSDTEEEKLRKLLLRYEAYNAVPTRDFSKALVENGFAIYSPINFKGTDDPDEWEYGCLYYYWNRHNDNKDANVMGPMEFGVVRNNIYKLTLKDLKSIGHPVPRGDIYTDPDPIHPKTDDEINDHYLTIEAKVVDWDVRKDDNATLY